MTGAEQIESQDLVYGLAASPRYAEDGVCFAARPSGLYRSEDGGLTWTGAYASLELRQPLPTAAVGVSPAFAGDRTVLAGVPGGILRSTDGGHNWVVVQLPSPPPFVLSLAISPDFARDGVALAATVEDGVFRSGDRGASWAAWNFGLLDLNVLSLALSPAFGQDETAFAGTDSGIFRSTNGGRAWRETGFPVDQAPVMSLAVSPHFAQDGLLWAGTESNGLYRSADAGQTWVRVAPEVITGAVNQVLLGAGSSPGPELMVLAGEGLLISRDGGGSWAALEAGPPLECAVTAVAAPLGLLDVPLLLGCLDGTVCKLHPGKKGQATCG